MTLMKADSLIEKIKIKDKMKDYLRELLSLKASTSSITWGFTIGAFVSFIPIYGIKTILIAAATSLLKKNFTAAFISSFIFGSPFIALPLYALEYKIGLMITGFEVARLPANFLLTEIARVGWQIIVPLFVGCLVVALCISALIHIAFAAWFKKRRQKLEASV